MKDTKNDGIYFQDASRWVKTKDDGRLQFRPRLLADYGLTSYPEPGEFRFEDQMSKQSGLEVVKGIPNSNGRVTPNPVPLTSVTKLQTDRTPQPHPAGIQSIKRLPSGLTVQGVSEYQLFEFGTDESFLRQASVRNFLPLSANDERTFHLRLVVMDFTKVRKNKAVISFAEPNNSQAFFTVGFGSNTSISAIFHDTSGGAGYKEQIIPLAFNSGSSAFPGVLDIYLTPKLDSDGFAAFGHGYVYKGEQGKQNTYLASPIAGTHTPRTGGNGEIYGDPAMFMGFGELTGGVDHTFTADDYLTGSFALRATVFKGRLTEKEMRGLSFKNGTDQQYMYRSGIESAPPKSMLRNRDRVPSYPQSRQPIGRRLQNKAADPFNDAHTFDAVEQPLVYPEMIPLSMFSGSVASAFSRAGDGGGTPLKGKGIDYLPLQSDGSSSADTVGFQISTQHHTPLDKRMIASGIPRESVMHTDSYRFQRFTTNEVVFGSNSSVMRFYRSDEALKNKKLYPNIKNRNPLGERTPSLYPTLAYNSGSIAPFNESKVSADAAHINQPAVSSNVYQGLQQKLGDHLVLEIPLNPEESTTFGIDRKNNFSMGYFNFANSKWDAVGQIPGMSGSHRQIFGGTTAVNHINYNGLIASTSLGFAGTTGFALYPENGSRISADLKHRGAPTDLFGFPSDNKYKANDSQLLDMSDYIDSPFILERWEIQFEADVEESGPESLGYVMPTRTETGDFSRIYEKDGVLINRTQLAKRWADTGFLIDPGHIARSTYPLGGTGPSTGSYDFAPSSPGVYWPGWRAPSRTAARAAITFDAVAEPTQTITIEDSNGVSIEYTAITGTTNNFGSNEFAISTQETYGGVTAPTVYTMVENIKLCIEHSTGHNGSIKVTPLDTATSADHGKVVLVLDMATAGTAGNGRVLTTNIPTALVDPWLGGGGNAGAFRLARQSGAEMPGAPLSEVADNTAARPSGAGACETVAGSLTLDKLVIPSSRYAQRPYETILGMTTASAGLYPTGLALQGIDGVLTGNVGAGIPPDIFRPASIKKAGYGLNQTEGNGGALSNGFSIARGLFLGSSPVYNVAAIGDNSTSAGGVSTPRPSGRQFTNYFRPSLYITGNLYPAGHAGYYHLSSGTMLPHGGTQKMRSGSAYVTGEGNGPKYPVLWSGRNGQPTGSNIGITEHRENVQVVASNGVPFWRCDTFFLLRQFATTNSGYKQRTPTQISSFGTAPAQVTAVGGQGSSPKNATGNDSMYSKPIHTLASSPFPNIPVTVVGPRGQRPPGQNDNSTAFYQPTTLSTIPTLSTREMITYSQMSTYGYAAAASFEDGTAVTQAAKVGNSGFMFVETTSKLLSTLEETGGYGINIHRGDGVGRVYNGGTEGILLDTSASFIAVDVAGSAVPNSPSSAVVPITTSSFAFGGGSIVNAPGAVVNSGSHEHWSKYGSFHSNGVFFDGPQQGEIAGISTVRPARALNWLDAGLSRDLNVFVRPDQGTRAIWKSQQFLAIGAPGSNFSKLDMTGSTPAWSVRGEGTLNIEREARGGFIFEISGGGAARTGGNYIESNDIPTFRIWFKNGGSSDTTWRGPNFGGPSAADIGDGDPFANTSDSSTYNWAIAWQSIAQSSTDSAQQFICDEINKAFRALVHSPPQGAPKANFFVAGKVVGEPTFHVPAGATNGGLVLSASQVNIPSGFKVIYQGEGNARSTVAIKSPVTEQRSNNFTVLTASICSTDGAGAHSAAGSLSANLYQKNFISTGSFRVHAPVRKATKSIRTAPTYLTDWYDDSNGTNANNYQGFTFSNRQSAAFLSVPFTPGAKKSTVSSGRNFIGRVSADEASNEDYAWQRPYIAATNQTVGDPLSKLLLPQSWSKVEVLNPSSVKPSGWTQLSGSAGTKVSDEGLYVLMPGDKLVLGFQPSQHGGNPGFPQPLNTNIRPYNPYGNQAPIGVNNYVTNSAGIINPELTKHGFETRQAAARKNMGLMTGNTETLYEPAHSFTMKKGKAKLVLYGTLLRNDSYQESNLNQQLVTNEIHQAIGVEPVLDQFLLGNVGEYSGSYLNSYISGSTNLRQSIDSRAVYSRGVKLSAFNGNLGVSGSFQRFVTLTDQSELIFDSLLPSLGDITKNLGLPPRSYKFVGSGKILYGISTLPVINLGSEQNAYFFVGDSNQPISASDDATAISQFNALSSWPHSFPFEEKWGSAERLVTITPGMGLFEAHGGDGIYLLTAGQQTMFRVPGTRFAAIGVTQWELPLSRTAGFLVTPFTASNGQNYMTGMARTGSVSASIGNEAGVALPGWGGGKIPKQYFANVRGGNYGKNSNQANSPRSHNDLLETPEGVRQGNIARGYNFYQPFSVAQAGCDPVSRWNLASGSFFSTPGPQTWGRDSTAKMFAWLSSGSLASDVSSVVNPGSITYELKASFKRSRTHYSILAGFWKGRLCVTGSPSPLNVLTTENMRAQKYALTASYNGDLPIHFSRVTGISGSHQKTQLDHPSGWKHGLSNCYPTKTAARFRPDRYGQIRDMLEQRQFTRFFDEGLSENVRGKTDSPISCIFVDIDGRPVDDPAETSCGNLSTAMTSSKPFIEGDVEIRIIKDRFISIT